MYAYAPFVSGALRKGLKRVSGTGIGTALELWAAIWALGIEPGRKEEQLFNTEPALQPHFFFF